MLDSKRSNVTLKIQTRINTLTKMKYFFPITMNLIVMGILNLLFYARYTNELDVTMQGLIYGSANSGAHIGHIVFSNIFLGEVLSTLCKIVPSVVWYTVFHYVMTFVCLVIVAVIIDEHNDRSVASRIISTVVSLFVGYELYLVPIYVKTSIVLLATSVLLLLDVLRLQGKRMIRVIVATVLAVVGALINYRIFMLELLVAIVFVAIYVVVNRAKLSNVKHVLVSFALILLCAISLHMVDNHIYATDSKWSAINDIRDMVEELWLFGAPKYDEIQEEILLNSEKYESIYELTEEQYNNIINGFYYDDIDYVEVLKLAKAMKYEAQPWNVLKFFRTIPIKMFKTGMFYLMLIILVSLYYGGAGKKTIGYFFTCEAMIFVPYFIDYWEKGYSYRVLAIIAYMIPIMYLVTKLENFHVEDNRMMAVFMALTGIVLYYIFAGTFNGATLYADSVDEIEEVSEEDEGKMIIVDLNQHMKQYSVYALWPKKLDNKSIYVGNGIYQLIPDYRSVTRAIAKEDYNGFDIKLRDSNADLSLMRLVELDAPVVGIVEGIDKESRVKLDYEISQDLSELDIRGEFIGEYSYLTFAVWSVEDGQDDLAWYDGVKINNNDETEDWVCKIDLSKHPMFGDIAVHIYSYSDDDPTRRLVAGEDFTICEQLNVSVSEDEKYISSSFRTLNEYDEMCFIIKSEDETIYKVVNAEEYFDENGTSKWYCKIRLDSEIVSKGKVLISVCGVADFKVIASDELNL